MWKIWITKAADPNWENKFFTNSMCRHKCFWSKKEFKFYHIDSGLLYRKIAKIFLEKKIDINNKKQFVSILKNIKTIPISNSKKLRTLKVSKMTSEISKISKIRNLVNFNQREILNKNRKKYRGFVIDGRDIGSVVF